MSLEINKNTNLNKWNYVEKVKEKFSSLQETIEKDPEQKDFVSFCLRVITPAYENYIQNYLTKEKWIDIFNDEIDNDDKQIFPDWEKSWIKYFNDFMKWIKNWIVKVSVNFWSRDFEKNMNIFYGLDNKLKLDIFRMIYDFMYEFNSLNRNLRITVKLDLDKLKKKIK